MKKAGGMILNSMIAALTVVVATAADVARAEKMDAEIHSVVIQKLEQTLRDAREDKNLSLRPVRARLADLYAERARLKAMNEAEQGCSDCKGALEDRVRALKMYDLVLAESSASQRGPLMLQMAQMHELNAELKKSAEIYEKMIIEGPKRHARSVYVEAVIGRAETRFSRGDVDGAQKDFETAYKMVDHGRKGEVMHRIAWCRLNKGQQPEAVRTLITILQTPDLMRRNTTEEGSFDAAFQEDVARDLATFFAHGEVRAHEIALLEELAPEHAKKSTMKHLATECERLGQKKAAIAAWAAEAKYEEKSSEKLEAMVRIAQIRFDLDDKKAALQGLRSTIQVWTNEGCDDHEVCDGLKNRLRNLVLQWNKSEKKQPSKQLVEAYQTYLAGFEDDMEMTHWAAEAARGSQQPALAAKLYYKSAVLSSKAHQAAQKAENKAALKKAATILESAVVGEVEMAEISKDKAAREVAYDHYLQLNPNGAISAKIKYQRAHLAYERGLMLEASNRFHDFVLSNSCRQHPSADVEKLCLQAADLDLDALVGLKSHSAVQARGMEYARLYSVRRAEYAKIARTAVLMQAKQMEAQGSSAAVAKLAEADFTGASVAERVTYLKTSMAMTEKVRDLEATGKAAALLLATKGISEQDREFALGKKAWAAEMSLDFATAYATYSKMKLANLKPEDRAMKLALMAELAGRNPKAHQEEFLRVSRDSFQKAFVQAKMIRAARAPGRELVKHEKALLQYPSLYATLVVEIFAKTGDMSLAQRALQNRKVAQEPASRLMAREIYLRGLAKIDAKLASHRLVSANEYLVKRTLGQRLELLAVAEKEANKAISARDWTSQILALSILSREDKRLYEDIKALPVPRQLRGEARDRYQQLVEMNARGYLAKHEQIEKKLSLLWGQGEAQAALENDYKSAAPSVRGLVGEELKKLAAAAPYSIRRDINETLDSVPSMPSDRQLAQARSEASDKPFSRESLLKLRNLESVRGSETMVTYLDARLMKMQSGEVR